MAGKQDIRVERSRDAIKKAFVDLMKRCEYEDITVKDLAEEARINRKTFYAHYETKQDLFESMMDELFDEIFGCFMYPKENPQNEPDEAVMRADIRRLLLTATKYSDELDVLITDQTATMTFLVTEQVILRRAKMIRLLTDAAPGRVPMELYVMQLKNFFLGIMDWWLGQQDYTLEEAVDILYKFMRRSSSTMFRYERGR